ncbi:MAG: hypothetical protein MJZ30_01380 [Paludibacteraceae bacterium]|nr:hypothetical protein [Paludibacteraceae bacterium]
MFLNLKRKYIDSSATSFLKKTKRVRDKRFINWDDVSSVLILLDVEHINHALFSKLYQKVSDKKVKIWCMIPKYDPRTGDSENVFFFDRKSISLLEKPNNIITGKFLSENYDVLIDLTRKESLPLKYLAMISTAHCKCGLDKPLYDFYDLKMSMSAGAAEEQLLDQILFYLRTIKTK